MGSVKSKYSVDFQTDDYFFYSQTSFRHRGKRCRKRFEDIPEDFKPSLQNFSFAKLSVLATSRSRKGSASDLSKTAGQTKAKSLLSEINETVTQITTQFDLLDEDHLLNRFAINLRHNSGDLLQILAKYLHKFEGIPVKLPGSLYGSLTSPFSEFVGIVAIPRKEWQLISSEQKHEEEVRMKSKFSHQTSQVAAEDAKSTSVLPSESGTKSVRKPSEIPEIAKKKKSKKNINLGRKGKSKAPSLQGIV